MWLIHRAQFALQSVRGGVNKAKKALAEAGLSYTEGTLEQVELANKPGALAELPFEPVLVVASGARHSGMAFACW